MSQASMKAEIGTRETAPVDLVHLARFTLGDRALEREVLSLFRTQSSQCLEKLQDADDAFGGEAWQMTVHTIKGSARGIGAWSVAECAEEAERVGAAAAGADARALLALLESEISRTNAYIGALLDE